MIRNLTLKPVLRQTFLLNKQKWRTARLSSLHPEIVTSLAGLKSSLIHATKDSLWISYDKSLTQALLQNMTWHAPAVGSAVLVHAMKPETLPAMTSCFKRFAFAPSSGFLPPEELAEALQAERRCDLFLGGSVDRASRTITLWRGNLEPLTVPFSAFRKSGDGIRPNFDRLSVIDCGQTVRLGGYEAGTDAILYEFDADYRRRMNKRRRQSERSFGASVRRLRKQRGLRREDFAPAVAAKTVARIEQGQVRRIQKRTLNALARRLRVKPETLGTF